MTPENAIVFILDGDQTISRTIRDLVAGRGLSSLAFDSIAQYTAFHRPDVPCCLILDVELPDGSGLDFLQQIEEGHPPVIFVTALGDIRASVRAMKSGAVNFLTKPLNEADLIHSTLVAIDQDKAARAARFKLAAMRQRHNLLTPRERDVLPLIVGGLLNKQAAALLGISEVTLQIHRSRIMQKMEAESLPELVRIAHALQVPVTHSRRAVGLGSSTVALNTQTTASLRSRRLEGPYLRGAAG
jgi:FixJ family two-component response regulator